MNTSTRAVMIALCGLVLGGVGNSLFPIPSTMPDADASADLVWELPADPAPQVQAIEAIWSGRKPWGAPPPPPPPPPPAEIEPPAPVLIGVVRTGRAHSAVFMIEGAGQLILPAGAALPGGGRVLSVAGLKVTWVDAKRKRHQRQVFDTYQVESSP